MQQEKIILLSPNRCDAGAWVDSIPQKWISLTPISPEEKSHIHSEYKDQKIYKAFRKYALDICLETWGDRLTRQRLLCHTNRYHIHHKLPLSFGGTNDFDNLVVIDNAVHQVIHIRLNKIWGRFLKLERAYRNRKSLEEKETVLASMLSFPGLCVTTEGDNLKPFAQIHCPEGPFCIPHKTVQQALAP